MVEQGVEDSGPLRGRSAPPTRPRRSCVGLRRWPARPRRAASPRARRPPTRPRGSRRSRRRHRPPTGPPRRSDVRRVSRPGSPGAPRKVEHGSTFSEYGLAVNRRRSTTWRVPFAPNGEGPQCHRNRRDRNRPCRPASATRLGATSRRPHTPSRSSPSSTTTRDGSSSSRRVTASWRSDSADSSCRWRRTRSSSGASVPTYCAAAGVTDAPDDPVYLSFHGGALVLGGGDACRLMGSVAAMSSGMVTWAPDYRMPPPHPYPAPLDDAVAVYRVLLEQRAPRDIVVGGGSAGGNLAAALLVRAMDEGLPMPGALVLLTPEVDLTESGDSFQTNLGIDNVLGRLSVVNDLYANGHDLAHPYLSPLFADVTGFPPTYLQTGTRDLFLSNTVRMHRKLRAAGVDAELHVFEAMPHGGFGGAPPRTSKPRPSCAASSTGIAGPDERRRTCRSSRGDGRRGRSSLSRLVVRSAAARSRRRPDRRSRPSRRRPLGRDDQPHRGVAP